MRKNWKSHFSTLMGAIVAIATAWSTIDLANFHITTDWKFLVLPALIALGGYLTKLNVKDKNNGTETN